MDVNTKNTIKKLKVADCPEAFDNVFEVEEAEYLTYCDDISWRYGEGWQREDYTVYGDGYRWRLGSLCGKAQESYGDAIIDAFDHFDLDLYISDYGDAFGECTFKLDKRWEAGSIEISDEALKQLLYISDSNLRCEILELAVYAAQELGEPVITRSFIKLAQEGIRLQKDMGC